MTHYEYIFEEISAEQNDLLVAELSEIGFDGFEEQDSTLMAFVKTNEFQQNLFDVLIEKYNVSFSKSTVSEKNWNEEWEKDFKPIMVKSKNSDAVFCFVRASFYPPHPGAEYDIIITPKMSFGTGHHATTFQMVEAMSNLDLKDKHIVDFGTGTGLLAILAEKMGAKEIIAIDNDDWSINNAQENMLSNGCSKIRIEKSDFCSADAQFADVVLANINLNVIKANLSHIIKCCKPNATVIFSGILTEDRDNIVTALASASFELKSIQQYNGWLLVSTVFPSK
jgi:ribosomal protein L11 methyltransferase